MAELGLVVNARNAMPDAAELGALGLSSGWLRTIVYKFDELDDALMSIGNRPRICVVLNSETEGVGNNYAGWASVVGQFAARFRGRIQAVECGNEFDLLGLPDTHAARMVNLAADTLHAAGMKVILASVAGPRWPEYLASSAAMVKPGAADYCALHPYGQRAAGWPENWGFGEIIDAVQLANERAQLPVALTECGIKVGDAGGEAGQAEYVRRLAGLLAALPDGRCPFACYFAWRDDIGGPDERGDSAFGLRAEDGRARQAWQAFAQAHSGQVQPPSPPENRPHYQLGFARWAALEPALIGEPLEDEYGPTKGLSAQRTSAGRLLWANLKEGPAYVFWADDGGRYLWRDGWPASQRVPAA